MSTDQLSMSMFATRADYDEAVRVQHEQLPGLQLAVKLLAQIGDDSDRAIAAVHDLAEAHAQRLTLQHHAADQVWRIADLEVKCVTLKELHDAAADERDALAQQHRSQHDADSAELRQLCADRDAARGERDALRAKYDELLVALHGIGRALGIPEGERSPYSVTCGTLERVNRLAEIEAQEPVAISKAGNLFWAGNPQDWRGVDCSLYATHVPAQAVPDGWRLVPVEHRQRGFSPPPTAQDLAVQIAALQQMLYRMEGRT